MDAGEGGVEPPITIQDSVTVLAAELTGDAFAVVVTSTIAATMTTITAATTAIAVTTPTISVSTTDHVGRCEIPR
jgi:hypothetical protein